MTTPSDDELDRLLASRVKDTTPEFEARWVELKHTLCNVRTEPRRRAPAGAWWALWLATGVAAAGLWVLTRPASPRVGPALEELWAMNEVLTHGTALLDAESRSQLLYVSNP